MSSEHQLPEHIIRELHTIQPDTRATFKDTFYKAMTKIASEYLKQLTLTTKQISDKIAKKGKKGKKGGIHVITPRRMFRAMTKLYDTQTVVQILGLTSEDEYTNLTKKEVNAIVKRKFKQCRKFNKFKGQDEQLMARMQSELF